MDLRKLFFVVPLAIGLMAHADETFSHRVVAEEATGTWCGYCIRGIVAIDELVAQYPEDFIPICVHAGDDPMALSSYPTPMSTESLPRMCVNRDAGTVNDPSKMSTYVNIQFQMVPEGEISFTECVLSDDQKNIHAEVSSRFDHAANGKPYGIAFVLVENDVYHPDDYNYVQMNAYAGGDLGEMGGYEDLGNYILPSDIKYQYVARAAYGDAYGYEGSVPDTYEAFEPFNFAQDLDLPIFVDNVNNLQLIALLLDENGVIINADRFSISGYENQEAEWAEPEFSQPNDEYAKISWPDGYKVELVNDAAATLIIGENEYSLMYENHDISTYLNDLFVFFPYEAGSIADGSLCHFSMNADCYTLSIDGVKVENQDLDIQWEYGPETNIGDGFSYDAVYSDGVASYVCVPGYFVDIRTTAELTLKRDGVLVATYGKGSIAEDIDWNNFCETLSVTLDAGDISETGDYVLTLPASDYWLMSLEGEIIESVDLVAEFTIQSDALSTVATGKAIKDVYYSTLSGVSVSNPQHGLFIKTIVYQDGTTIIQKFLLR